jgi:hypothetical protein
MIVISVVSVQTLVNVFVANIGVQLGVESINSVNLKAF